MKYKVQITILALILLTSCNGDKMTEKTIPSPSIKDIPASSWKKLAQKKIYFGHQSVGNNIIAGIKDIISENPHIKLNIVETTDRFNFNKALFAHSKIGKNFDPKSKIDEFFNLINDDLGQVTDIASFKFCYVDIRSDTNIESIFEDYNISISQLKNKHSELNVVHFTVPLRVTLINWKTKVKKIIGRSMQQYDDNIKRNEYNELLLKKYNGKELIFDIAKFQSTFPDGTRCTFIIDGKTYYSLIPEYTNDGGHLNDKGRKIVAEQFLIFLANLSI